LFYGRSFTISDQPSEFFNILISSPEGGDVSTNASNDVELMTESIYRRPKVYLLGVKQSPVLEFDVHFNTPTELDASEAANASRWLFGSQTYRKLQIMQPDMDTVYFNCFLTNPQIKRVGNIVRGFSATVVCDAPWAWEFEKTYSFTASAPAPAGYPSGNVYYHYNETDSSTYIYPNVEFTTNIFGDDVSIINISDNARNFEFTGLNASETITINGETKILASDSLLNRLGNFNKNFLRLVPGLNRLFYSSSFSSLEMSYSTPKKVS